MTHSIPKHISSVLGDRPITLLALRTTCVAFGGGFA